MIETEEQYERALAIVEELFFKADKTPLEGQLLEVWTALIENYEQATFSPESFSNPVSGHDKS